MSENLHGIRIVELTADIVSAYVANNHVQPSEVATVIREVHAALSKLGAAVSEPVADVAKPTPAQIRKSITPDALISFEDGKAYKTLRRHLTTRGLTPEEYRAKYGLPYDYPMTSASYSAQRSQLAIALGLGQQRVSAAAPAPAPQPAPEPIQAEAPATARKGRGAKAAAPAKAPEPVPAPVEEPAAETRQTRRKRAA